MALDPKPPVAHSSRPRFYYGWVIVATMFIVSLAQTAQYNPALSIFLKPITEEFGWSRTTFSSALAVGGFAGAGLAVIIGPVLDRHGPRTATFLAFLLMGIVTMALSSISEIWHLYAIIVTNRALITGLLSIVAGVAVSKWFIRRRGRAMSFAVTGLRFGQAVVPPYTTFFVLRTGWQSAAIALGAFIWILTLIPVILLLRRQPEDMGLRPDGDGNRSGDAATASESGDSVRDADEASYTLGQALHTPAFYLILLATSGLAFTIGGLNFNLFPYLTDQGLSPAMAAGILTTWSLISSVGSLGAGFIAERVHVRFVMAFAFTGATTGVIALILADDPSKALVFALVHGLSFGSLPMLMQLVWADYYGRRHQGAIRGFVTPFQVIVQAGGPIAGTLVFDLMDTYVPAFVLFGVVYIMSAIAMLLAKPVPLPTPASAHHA